MPAAENLIIQKQAEVNREAEQAAIFEQAKSGALLDLKNYGECAYYVGDDMRSAYFESLVEEPDADLIAALFRFYATSQKANQLGFADATRKLAALLDERVEDMATTVAQQITEGE